MGSVYNEKEPEQLFKAAKGDVIELGVIFAAFYGLQLSFANGVSLREIQKWLGQSNISTTSNIYTHLTYSSKVASANAILNIFPYGGDHEKTTTYPDYAIYETGADLARSAPVG